MILKTQVTQSKEVPKEGGLKIDKPAPAYQTYEFNSLQINN